MIKTSYISVGSNLGDRLANCFDGISYIEKSGNSSVVCNSGFYLTSPLDYENQDWFVNAVVKIRTTLSAHDLLNELISIQHKLGRNSKTVRFGPRTLDLDIIFYENDVVSLHALEIPHPRMHKRVFVLRPFCDINPWFIHPIFKVTVWSILKKMLKSEKFQKIIPIDDYARLVGGNRYKRI